MKDVRYRLNKNRSCKIKNIRRQSTMTKMVINPNRKLSRINREIYGHFSEHLGRCIYEGIYVGENSRECMETTVNLTF